jgi:hypothetical protein
MAAAMQSGSRWFLGVELSSPRHQTYEKCFINVFISFLNVRPQSWVKISSPGSKQQEQQQQQQKVRRERLLFDIHFLRTIPILQQCGYADLSVLDLSLLRCYC